MSTVAAGVRILIPWSYRWICKLIKIMLQVMSALSASRPPIRPAFQAAASAPTANQGAESVSSANTTTGELINGVH